MKAKIPQGKIPEDTGRTVALALAFFGGLAALAAAAGVHERLSNGTLLALLGFALAFAVSTYRLDPAVREWIDAKAGRVGARFRKRAAKPRAAKRAAT